MREFLVWRLAKQFNLEISGIEGSLNKFKVVSVHSKILGGFLFNSISAGIQKNRDLKNCEFVLFSEF